MGDLLLCSGPIAALPYYVEGIAMNVYSIEELGYYIANNTYLLEKNFMNAELCTWIASEVNNQELSDTLKEIMERNGSLSEFVFAILKESGYCSNQEMIDIIQILKEMDEKSDFERNKIRADRFMEKEKYLKSIYEYKQLLAMDREDVSPALKGDIWHNLGFAYAKMFLFHEAAKCFEKAYRFNENPESMKEHFFAVYCMNDTERFDGLIRGYGLDDMKLQEIKNEIHLRVGEKSFVPEWMNQQMEKEDYRKKTQEVILEWKEDYRRISRS